MLLLALELPVLLKNGFVGHVVRASARERCFRSPAESYQTPFKDQQEREMGIPLNQSHWHIQIHPVGNETH